MTKSFFTQRPFALYGLLAIPSFICLIAIYILMPEGTFDGYANIILRLEFSHRPLHIRDSFQQLTLEQIRNIEIATWIDGVLAICYISFIHLFFLKGMRYFDLIWMEHGRIFALVALVAEGVENAMIICITRVYEQDNILNNYDLIPYVEIIPAATWFKWAAISLALFEAGLAFLIQWRRKYYIAAALCMPAFPIYAVAWFYPALGLVHAFVLACSIGLAAFMVFSFFIPNTPWRFE